MEIKMYNELPIKKEEDKNKNKKTNKKKVIKISAILIIITMMAGIIITYSVNEDIRQYIDYNILQKEIKEENTRHILLNEDNNSYVTVYNNYIAVLNNNILRTYNALGKEEFHLDITITNPIFASKNKYLAIAEEKGKKIYLISEKNIVWQTDVDGDITRINVNKNGYVSVVITQSTYKSVVITYNPQGKELFKIFLSDSYAVDTDISNDNKYLAIAEINTSGTALQSSTRIISLEKIETDANNATIYNKTSDINKQIIGLQYADSNNLLIMYNDDIRLIKEEQEKTITEFGADTKFASIELNKKAVEVKQTYNSDLKTKSIVNIIDVINNNISKFNVEAIPKEVTVNTNNIAINIGTEAYFIGSNGWLKKKYVSKQEIKEIILGDNISAIVYNNKINIINL